MAGSEKFYFYLAFGSGIIWALLGFWYFCSAPSARTRWSSQWWKYLLVWPWLLGNSRDDLNREGRNLTWRELTLVMFLILLMVEAVIFERFFPLSSRTPSP